MKQYSLSSVSHNTTECRCDTRSWEPFNTPYQAGIPHEPLMPNKENIKSVHLLLVTPSFSSVKSDNEPRVRTGEMKQEKQEPLTLNTFRYVILKPGHTLYSYGQDTDRLTRSLMVSPVVH